MEQPLTRFTSGWCPRCVSGAGRTTCDRQPCAGTRTGSYLQPALWQDVEALSIRGRVTTAILQAIQVIAPLFHANSNFVFEIDYFLSSPWQKAPRHSSGDASRPSCVAPLSNMSNVLPRRTLSTGRSAGHGATRAALAATRGFTTSFQPAFLTTRRSKHTIQPPGLRCACLPCSTYCSSTPARAFFLCPARASS